MSEILKLELPEDAVVMREAAEKSGQTLEEWAAAQLRRCAPTRQEQEAALARLMQYAGTVDTGSVSSADNEAIDRDLAREYESTHEDDG